MSDRIRKDLARRDLVKAFKRAGKRKASTEYETEQEAFWKNYERLKAERLARDAAKSKEK
jgi:DNA-binding transcriptional regulator GbsR (MarR family)